MSVLVAVRDAERRDSSRWTEGARACAAWERLVDKILLRERWEMHMVQGEGRVVCGSRQRVL